MKILLSWLNEYGDFGDPTNADDVQRIADALTALGLEVDSVTTVGETVPGVVTARVLRLEQHPDAAKVQRVYVDAGDGHERHVWCGAFNMADGRHRPTRHARHHHAQWHDHRAARHSRDRLRGHAVLGKRARPR